MSFDAKKLIEATLLIALVAGASACSASSTASPTPSRPTSLSSPAAEQAANQATHAYRASMTQAGQQLVVAVNQLAQADATNTAALPRDIAQLDQAYDVVRPQFTSTLSGSSSGPATPGDLLGGVDVSPALLDEPSQQRSSAITVVNGLVQDIQLALGRVVLPPSGIAVSARQDAEWIALHAAPAAANSTNGIVSWSDIETTSSALAGWAHSLSAIGAIVAPRTLATTSGDVTMLQSAVVSWNGGSVRNVVEAADAVANDLGDLSSALSGYGLSGAYQ